MKFIQWMILTFILIALSACTISSSKGNLQTTHSVLKEAFFEFTYTVELPPTNSARHVFIPLAETDQFQQVILREVNSVIMGSIEREARFGNAFWYGKIPANSLKPTIISVRYRLKRQSFHNDPLVIASNLNPQALTEAEQSLLLQADRLVPVDGELVDRVLADIPRLREGKGGRAREIYDYVVDTMDYKKIGQGWGNGDTFWACSQKYGNCTDFHALFISLARAEKIPSRFEIGFPINLDRMEGEVSGYHCWVNFHLPEIGWVPVDASEAKKNLKLRDFYFGHQPPDRITMSRGRDLQLGKNHKTAPLNYFVYPHVESKGKIMSDFKTTLHYRLIQ
jgi:transglutaminase-like putative cysteine protease